MSFIFNSSETNRPQDPLSKWQDDILSEERAMQIREEAIQKLMAEENLSREEAEAKVDALS